jgi:vancomycin resistance protein VanW
VHRTEIFAICLKFATYITVRCTYINNKHNDFYKYYGAMHLARPMNKSTNVPMYLIKRFIKIQIRYVNDRRNNTQKSFPSRNNSITNIQDFQPQIRIEQAILPSETKVNKIHNLQIAAQKIEKIVLESNAVFSFWYLVGNPSEKNGYKKGRNILNGKLSEAIGGGLCQLSGILHHVALVAGLKIIERHAHTLDLYKDEERFTPLGADATIVYGYKDLRFRQTLSFPVFFQFEIKNDALICELWAKERIFAQEIEFIKVDEGKFVKVEAVRNGKILEVARYGKYGD